MIAPPYTSTSKDPGAKYRFRCPLAAKQAALLGDLTPESASQALRNAIGGGELDALSYGSW